MIIRKSSFNTYKYLIIILLIAGCAFNDKLKDARKYLHDKNFVPAIMLYDKYIDRYHYSAEETIAELERSDCYYQLGLQAYTKKNWVLADRLFYLSNSDKADDLADNVHLELAIKAEAEGDIDNQLKHYNYVINYIPDSELVPLMLRKRIDIYLARKQNVSAYTDYKKLWEMYPETDEADTSIEVIDPLIPWFLENPHRMRERENFAAAIAEFQLYANYPSSYQEMIYREIAVSYYQWAMSNRLKLDYPSMRDNFDLAVSFDPALLEDIEHIKSEVCDQFILAGDALMSDGEIEKAIQSYKQCFLVRADNPAADEKIELAKEQRRRFAQADSLFAQAQLQENRKEYQNAKNLYRESWKLSRKKVADQKSLEMANYLRAEKNPTEFALEIIRDYQQGIIKLNVDKKLAEIKNEFGDQVSNSDWKAVYSYGEFNFEVRIDIFSPAESYYFAWRINLIERSISPLNKASESMMK